ncbi:nicotinate phosphoribosyltransferase [Vibrio orientalis CIP 102891 = ATCC 33934]|uniref:Nicotinate phosphoribosyltransferase n=1 Tax=Vibrio orientalis CIP 102891 = ATCC 33934 TaxID=675816 RepID=C9QK54_VIBOR|nr:nicotinate phosphoribosyltransferase [Vibrio orientalis]EEX92045.1 nicotinate phosphoribosyltransferase [Vibrio orientalis CIP 102891 = ATCC 33934]EGU48802.1 nicotinate phosphoribosyltransferase [Vibrio orientalis CIP 102891 = ATCC 33934]
MSASLFNDNIIQSALDLDVYKINMMFAAFTHYPQTEVRYELIVRSSEDLSDLHGLIKQEINQLSECYFTTDDIAYLEQNARYLSSDFLSYLADFRFLAKQQVTMSQSGGQLSVSIKGVWHETILYETLVMSIISEVRSRQRWNKIPPTQFSNVLEQKVSALKSELSKRSLTNFNFSEMGSRRRFSAQVQHDVVAYLNQHVPELMTGTSNYHLAKKFGLTPIGTVAHEWFMAHQALVAPAKSQQVALDLWQSTFSGKLGIALTDTIGIDAFLKDFNLERANAYAGVRHDSGNPFEWGDKMITHYESLGIDPMSKVLIFTDGLNFARAIEICEYFAGRANISFGIGTFLANDMGGYVSDGIEYQPLSIVVKMAECNGLPVAKISDEPEKAMCEDLLFLASLKQSFGLLSQQA